jgi:hypothetical protein
MTKRITPRIKAIADAHIQAKLNKTFDVLDVSTVDQLKAELFYFGKTSEGVLEQIEIRFISITSLLISSQLGHISKAYKEGVYKGFKTLFANYK